MKAKTKKVTKRPVVIKTFALPIRGATLKSLTKAYEANGGKGKLTVFAAKCLAKGIAGNS